MWRSNAEEKTVFEKGRGISGVTWDVPVTGKVSRSFGEHRNAVVENS